MSILIENKAYAKMMLHCVKHTTSDCFGILLGSNKGDVLNVIDVIPLSHDKIFAPQLEIALKMIELYTDGKLEVVGMYENLMSNYFKGEEFSNSPHALLLCDVLHQKASKYPLLIEVCASETESENNLRTVDEIIIKLLRYNGTNSFDKQGEYKETEEQFNQVKDYIKNFKQIDIVDFDDHFMNADLDWRNNFI